MMFSEESSRVVAPQFKVKPRYVHRPGGRCRAGRRSMSLAGCNTAVLLFSHLYSFASQQRAAAPEPTPAAPKAAAPAAPAPAPARAAPAPVQASTAPVPASAVSRPSTATHSSRRSSFNPIIDNTGGSEVYKPGKAMIRPAERNSGYDRHKAPVNTDVARGDNTRAGALCDTMGKVRNTRAKPDHRADNLNIGNAENSVSFRPSKGTTDLGCQTARKPNPILQSALPTRVATSFSFTLPGRTPRRRARPTSRRAAFF